MSIKPREIAICGYKHSGVDWLEKIVTLFANQTQGTNHRDLKIYECVNTLPTLFPESWLSSCNKILFILRNPKDIAAAAYCTCSCASDNGFGGFLDNFVLSRSLDASAISWFDHTSHWGEFLKTLQTKTVYIVYFENLVHNFRTELEKMCSFLELPCDEDLLNRCCNRLDIDHYMQNDGPRRKRRKTDQDEDATHIAITYEVDTWKRLFMVGQNEEFDKYIRAVMKGSAINLDLYL